MSSESLELTVESLLNRSDNPSYQENLNWALARDTNYEIPEKLYDLMIEKGQARFNKNLWRDVLKFYKETGKEEIFEKYMDKLSNRDSFMKEITVNLSAGIGGIVYFFNPRLVRMLLDVVKEGFSNSRRKKLMKLIEN